MPPIVTNGSKKKKKGGESSTSPHGRQSIRRGRGRGTAGKPAYREGRRRGEGIWRGFVCQRSGTGSGGGRRVLPGKREEKTGPSPEKGKKGRKEEKEGGASASSYSAFGGEREGRGGDSDFFDAGEGEGGEK